MSLFDILQGIFAGNLQQDNANLKDQLSRLQNSYATKSASVVSLTSDKQSLTAQIAQLTLQVQSLEASNSGINDVEKQQIAQLTAQIIDLQNKLRNQPVGTLYHKPLPNLLVQVPPNNVMKGNFYIQTSQGVQELIYPDHPSIFMPCPIFEDVLNAAKVNYRAEELTPIEICKKIATIFQNTDQYLTDAQQWYGRLDSWTPAVMVKLLGKEDCESSSTAILSAIMYWQTKFGAFQDYSCFLGLGYFRRSGSSFGHAFVLILHETSTDLKDSYVIEATSEYSNPPWPLSTEKGVYSCEWGIIGFPREDYMSATYNIKPELVWWNAPAAGPEVEKMGILQQLKSLLTTESEDQRKKKAMDEYLKEKQVQQD